jgi:hypothetical protein
LTLLIADNVGLVAPEDVRVHGCGLEVVPPHRRVDLKLLADPLGVAFDLTVSRLAHEVTKTGDYAI